MASESEANMYPINGPEIMNKYYGETEAKLRDIFKEAKDNSPSIIFIDEIDAIAPKREEVYGDVEKRVVAQLLALMDGLTDRGNVIVLGATNRPDSVDPALRRPGRFDREFEITVPNEDERYEILQIHTRGMPINEDIDLKELSSELHGYTGADIKSLCREAAMKSIRRYLPEIDLETEKISSEVLQSMQIKLIDFYDAMHEVVPTAMREFYVERPKVWWHDVGGLDNVKKSLTDNIITAIKEPSKFAKMGIKPPKGSLLYGPPGCGKTLLARAVATETGANMILVRGPEILSKWVGESEKAVREIFRKAKASSPCVVIFDELDALAKLKSGEGGAGETILSQLLTEIEEGVSSRVVVIGITNRPDIIDNSLLRTGRLDLVLYVSPPDEKGRLEIIKILTKKMPLSNDVKLQEIAITTQNYTGADLAALCREAAVNAMRNKSSKITSHDFATSLKQIKPSITKEVDQWYNTVRESISNVVPKTGDKAFYG
jgi:transitional endoplasmic reticulum ATPase